VTVLVVEDNPLNRFLLTQQIRRFLPEATILDCSSGNEAIDIYQKLSPDLVFLDYYLPDTRGPQVARAIRQFEDTKKLESKPLIVLSASAEDHVEQEALRAGINEFGQKPLLPRDLHRLLKTYLRL